ncbi:MAG: hypothetical protein ABGY75_14565 [Gemmataceae bacterium]
MTADAKIARMLDDILEEVAAEYCDDLSDYLYHHHRITGLLAESIGYERVGPGEVDAGSDVPYAGLFEAKTGAVAKFTDQWQPKGGQVAVNAGRKAAGKL